MSVYIAHHHKNIACNVLEVPSIVQQGGGDKNKQLTRLLCSIEIHFSNVRTPQRINMSQPSNNFVNIYPQTS